MLRWGERKRQRELERKVITRTEGYEGEGARADECSRVGEGKQG